MSSTAIDTHRFHSIFAVRAFVATLSDTHKSFRIIKVPRPKPGQPVYVVISYGT